MDAKCRKVCRGRFYFSLIFILFSFTQRSLAQALPDSVIVGSDTVLFFMPGNFTYKIPDNCVTSITVQVWGGSGAGKGVASGATNGGGGGGGGAFSSATLTVTPGAIMNLTVGGNGMGGAGNGGDGTDSWFGSTSTVMAKGGKGSTGTAGGAGGTAAASVGSTKFSGGAGGNYGGNGGGGGGASGSLTANGAVGSNGSGSNGGAGGVGTIGSGGAGGSNNGIGQDNSQCAGCGGGGGVGTNGGNGGHGSGGLIKVVLPPRLDVSITGDQTICPGATPSAFPATATGASGGPYSYAWQSSTTDSISGFTTIGAATASTYSAGALSVTTWYRCIANAGTCLPDTSNTIKITVTDLSGTIAFPQTICSGSSPSTLTITTIPSNVAATYVWQSSTSGSGSGFAAIGGATTSTYSPGSVSVPTWYNAIISATGCVTYTATAVSITTSTAPATCNAGNSSTIYSTNVLPLLKSSVGGSVTTGAWSVFSSSPAGTHTLSSTAQTTDPAAVTFTPQAAYNGTVVLRLTTNSNGCNVSTCDKTINVIPATLTTVTFTTSGTTTWTVPSCVSTVTVQTWGAGGGGGSGGTTLQDDGSGGGGGAFSSSVLSVTQGTVYNLNVGAGGIGAVHTGSGKKGDNGGDSWFGSSSTVFAQGGIGGLGVGQPGYGSPSPGGLITAGRGQVKYSGGSGASGRLWPGGSGGSSAGTSANGCNAPVPTDGSRNATSEVCVGPAGSGAGGCGGASNGGPGISGNCTVYLAEPGSIPGGGGGGGTNSCDQGGQAGANGQVKVIYGPSLPVFITANSATICSGQSVVLKASTEFPISYQWSTGATVDSIIVSPTANTSYTVTDQGGCAAPVTVTVTVNAAFAAGVTSTTICSGQPGTITATGASSYLWSTGATTNSITESPTSTSTYSVSASNNGCAIQLTGTIFVNNSTSLTVNSASICAGQTATLTASGATSYSWSPGTSLSATTGASVTSTPAADISYTVTGTSNGCSSTALSTVTVTSIPVSDAGVDITICSGTTGNIGAASVSGYSYSWSPATGLSDPTVSDPTVTITNNTASPVISSYTITTTTGCTSTDVVSVTVNPQDDPTFSYASAAYCAPSNDTPAKSTPGTGTFSINPATNLAITPSSGFIDVTTTTNVGYYVITLTTADACPNTYTVGIDVVANPDATFSYSAPAYCINATPNPTITQPSGSTAGTFSASPAGLVFISTATGEIDLAASTPNTYVVTNSIPAGGGCLATSQTTTITVNALPNVTSSSVTVCAGTAGLITASGATSYAWTGGGTPSGAGNQDLTDSPVNTTPYIVTGTTNGCSATATGTINITPNPIVTVTNSNDCAGIAQTITASGATTYTWSGGGVPSGTGNQDLTDTPIVPSTSYVVTGITNSCSGTATGTIVVDPNPSVTVTNSTACLGFPAILTATPANNASLVWSSSETTNSITKTPAAVGSTNYTVTVAGTNPACIDTAIATIFVNPNPTVTVTSSPAVCLGETSTLTASGPATDYSWSPGGSTQNPFTVVGSLGSVVYTVTGTITATGCTGTQTGTVTVNPIPTVTVNDATICAGQTATLTASGASTYAWSPNVGATASVSVTPGATISYTVTGSALGCDNTAVSNVKVNPLPIVTVNSASVCAGATATLTASGANTYSWLPGGAVGNSINVNPTATTPYTVIGTSLANCTGSAIGTVTAYVFPTAAFNDPATLTLSEANILFSNNSTNSIGYVWDFGDTATSVEESPQHQYADTGIYVICLKVFSNGGCLDSVCHDIKIVPDVLIFIPNSFSPDENGMNDGFGFKGSGVGLGFEMRIFDRWGEQLFFTTDVNELWQGDNKGVPCPQDVYVYKIVLKDSKGKDKIIFGYVNLIRGD